jgi:ribulose-5-phosphate 4-epimerase/fuculose-1-phosphate aldolase
MHRIINKYTGKLEEQGLAKKEDTVLIALDAGLYSNRMLDGDWAVLKETVGLMSISSILFARPAEPYWSMLQEILAYECGPRCIEPMDCETRTFFHDIPVIEEFTPQAIALALSSRKSAIIKDRGIVTYGTVTPEQAFVSFSSACFSIYVKYFYDSLMLFDDHVSGRRPLPFAYCTAFDRIIKKMVIGAPSKKMVPLMPGPAKNEEDVFRMLAGAGRAVVSLHLVDSYFGNISHVSGNNIFISQTGSSLDELEGCVDIVPLDGSSSSGITASSELSAHRNIFQITGHNAILHGHPKFSVIMSMYCKKPGCDRSLCHKACTEKRDILGTPVVPGEIGTGVFGLLNTVPAAMQEGRGAIVYGHGVFTSGNDDFRAAFDQLADIEDRCRDAYFRTVNELLQHFS